MTISDSKTIDVEEGLSGSVAEATTKRTPNSSVQRFGWLHSLCYTSLVVCVGMPASSIVAGALVELLWPLWDPLFLVVYGYGIIGPLIHLWLGFHSPRFDRTILFILEIIPNVLGSDFASLLFLVIVTGVAEIFHTTDFGTLFPWISKFGDHINEGDWQSHSFALNFILTFTVIATCVIGASILIGAYLLLTVWISMIMIRKLYVTGHKLLEMRLDVLSGKSPEGQWLVVFFVLLRATLVVGGTLYAASRTRDRDFSFFAFGYGINFIVQCTGLTFGVAHILMATTRNQQNQTTSSPKSSDCATPDPNLTDANDITSQE